MKYLILFCASFLFTLQAYPQTNTYEVYALKFGTAMKVPVAAIAVGAQSKDSVQICYMFLLLKGTNGKTILVDAGFTDTTGVAGLRKHIRPDVVLQRLGVQPKDITDVVITHPHRDHLNGSDLYPDAMVWMQKADYDYFVGDAWQKGGFTTGFKKEDVQKLVQRNLNKKLTLVKGDDIEIIPGVRVFIGSKHTYESQFVAVDTKAGKVVIASDNSWFYYNLLNDLPIPMTFDREGYRKNLIRMKSMVKSPDLVIPGHDPLVFTKFPKVAEDVVRIAN